MPEPAGATPPFDPVLVAVLRGALAQIVDEMDIVLTRASFSPVVSEALDRANGIYAYPDGGTVAQGETGLPIFIGSMEAAVRAIAGRIDEARLAPGDVFVTNDPYVGGTHLQDVKLVTPYYDGGDRPLFFLANTTHWMDIGGTAPGGFAAKSVEIYQEGIRIPPLKLVRAGELDEQLVELLLANVRVPFDIDGDLRAQLNALDVGAARLDELVAKHGADDVLAAAAAMQLVSERQMRSHIEEIPDGVYEAGDVLDSDGVEDRPLCIRLRMTVSGSDLLLDFSQSDPPCRGPLNLAAATTVAAAHVAIKHVFPDVPINAGCFAPIRFTIPTTTFLAAVAPRPVSGYFEASSRVADVVWQALAQAMPERLFASPFSTAGPMLIATGADPGAADPRGRKYSVTVVNYSGGYGATRSSDGLLGACPPLSAAPLAPLEVYEHRFPIEFRRLAIRQDSGGAGTMRGGPGTEYEFVFTGTEGVVSTIADRGRHGPPGAAGGAPGACTEIEIRRAGGEVYRPPHTTKDQGVPIRRGDVVTLRTPGGGGYGDPRLRERASVERDVARGYVGPVAAAEVYGLDAAAVGDVETGDVEAAAPSEREEVRIG